MFREELFMAFSGATVIELVDHARSEALPLDDKCESGNSTIEVVERRNPQ